jgi:hypothetical protein
VNITEPSQALQLPVGTLEIIKNTKRGRVCDRCSFSPDDVIEITARLLEQKVELFDFSAQAELIAYMTNHFGWKGHKEAFAL